MDDTLLLALATDTPTVRDTIKQTLGRYIEQQEEKQALEIKTLPIEYRFMDGIWPMIQEAAKNADTARQQHKAMLGIGGAWGVATVRESSATTLSFLSFFIALTCDGGLMATVPANGTYPVRVHDGLIEAMRIAGRPLYIREMPAVRLVDLGATALSAWSQLQFPAPLVQTLTLH